MYTRTHQRIKENYRDQGKVTDSQNRTYILYIDAHTDVCICIYDFQYTSILSIRGVAGTKKWGGRYFHLSCKLKYAEALLQTRSCHLWQKKVGGYAPPSQKVGGGGSRPPCLPFPTPLSMCGQIKLFNQNCLSAVIVEYIHIHRGERIIIH